MGWDLPERTSSLSHESSHALSTKSLATRTRHNAPDPRPTQHPLCRWDQGCCCPSRHVLHWASHSPLGDWREDGQPRKDSSTLTVMYNEKSCWPATDRSNFPAAPTAPWRHRAWPGNDYPSTDPDAPSSPHHCTLYDRLAYWGWCRCSRAVIKSTQSDFSKQGLRQVVAPSDNSGYDLATSDSTHCHGYSSQKTRPEAKAEGHTCAEDTYTLPRTSAVPWGLGGH